MVSLLSRRLTYAQLTDDDDLTRLEASGECDLRARDRLHDLHPEEEALPDNPQDMVLWRYPQ